MPISNETPPRTGEDGFPIVKVAASASERRFHLRSMGFQTARAGVRNRDHNRVDIGDATLIFKDEAGAVLTPDTGLGDHGLSTCTTTILSWRPNYDMEIIGGWIEIDPTLFGGTAGFYMSSVLAPHIPEAMGGSVLYVSEADLELASQSYVDLEGRATKLVLNDPVNLSNTIEFRFYHPAGAVKRFQILIESFK